MLSFKNDVKLSGIQPEMSVALFCIAQVFAKREIDVVISGCMEGKHMRGSKHYVGFALDVWSVAFSTKAELQKYARKIRSVLTKEFDVVVEWTNKNKKHLHVEFDPKTPIN